MMEEVSPAVAVTLSLGNSVCESSGISNHMEITRLKLVAETATLLSDPTLMLNDSWDAGYNCANPVVSEDAQSEADLDLLKMTEITENGRLVREAQESEEDEVLSVAEDATVELLSLGSTSDIAVPLDAAPEASMPIAVEIEGVENGQIVAKVISVEERSIKRRLTDDVPEVSPKPDEECSNGPTIKASVVAVQLSGEKNAARGGVKSVFELDCVPLWGSVSIIGNRPEMEDAVMAAPHFMKIPIKMFIGDQGIDGISQSLNLLTSHFFGVYDGHGGSQVANYCRDRIHLALVEELNSCEVDTKADSVNDSIKDSRQVQWENVFTRCFVKVDDEVSGKVSQCSIDPVVPETVGSTAVVAVVCSSHIIVANCGDSRAVLYRGREAIPLSIDHKPNRDDEYARIEELGGKVIQWNGHRVFGVLAMSRSIGS